MKKILIVATLIISNQLWAAIGCLPGDCCPGGVPCNGKVPPTPPTRPPHPCFTGELPKSLQTQSRFVSACLECNTNEACGEFTNNDGEIIGHQCLVVK